MVSLVLILTLALMTETICGFQSTRIAGAKLIQQQQQRATSFYRPQHVFSAPPRIQQTWRKRQQQQQQQQHGRNIFALRATSPSETSAATSRRRTIRSPYSLTGFVGGAKRKGAVGMIEQLNETAASHQLNNTSIMHSLQHGNDTAVTSVGGDVVEDESPLEKKENVVHNATTSQLFLNLNATANSTKAKKAKRKPIQPKQAFDPQGIFDYWMGYGSTNSNKQLEKKQQASLTDAIADPSIININEVKKNVTSQPFTTQNFFSSWTTPPNDINTSAAAVFPVSSSPGTVKRPLVLANRKPTDVLTVGDLETILQNIGYYNNNNNNNNNNQIVTAAGSSMIRSASSMPQSKGAAPSNTKMKQQPSRDQSSSKSGVAFPQMSVLSYRDLTIGSTISASVFGMLLSMTILPNLWFVGGVGAGIWGYQVSRAYPTQPPTNVMGELVISLGRRVAEAYLFCFDAINGVWFMYKTGQLSYAYYKKYAQMDDRFAITTKVDAWNARFQEGKENFDAWERENEVGRKVLAGLRTARLVGEKSFLRKPQRSYDGWFRRLWLAVRQTGGGSSALRAVLKGIRVSISQQQLDEIIPRAEAAVGAFLVLNIVGALFALSPTFLGVAAITTGLVWPTWVPELGERVSLLLSDLRAQGQGGVVPSTIGGEVKLGKQQFYDKSRYSYFTRQDGTKQWYRSGQSAYRWASQKKGKKKKSSSLLPSFSMPWSNNKRRPPAKEQWGLFG